MKVLFLDIDGVLQTGSGVIEREPVAHLTHVVQQTGCFLCISSSWRLIDSLDEIDSYLTHAGYRGPRPVSITPNLETFRGADRGLEICAWLASDLGLRTTSYAVVDDMDAREFTGVAHRLVQTNYRFGLDATAADRLIEVLG